MDKKHEDTTESGFYLDSSFNPNQHTRIYGEVVSVPKKLNPGVNEYYVYPGSPHPARHISGQFAKTRMEHLNVDELPYAKNPYDPSLYEDQFLPYHKTQRIDIEKGDRVYFHYLQVHDGNFLHLDEDKRPVFRIPYNQLFCAVRDGEIVMLNNWCLVDEYYKPGIEELEVEGKTIKGRTKQVGSITLVTTVEEEPEHFLGTITSIPPFRIPGFTPNVSPGDTVIFKDARNEFYNTIEGRKYYTMKANEVTAKVVDEELIAVGNNVVIDPEEYEYLGSIDLSAVDITSQTGTVVSVGEDCEYVEVGDRVLFDPQRMTKLVDHKMLTLPEPSIMMVLEKDSDVKLKTKKI